MSADDMESKVSGADKKAPPAEEKAKDPADLLLPVEVTTADGGDCVTTAKLKRRDGYRPGTR